MLQFYKNGFEIYTDRDVLISSIISKVASIVREYGVEHIRKNNRDHYYDVDNNEIVVLNAVPIISSTKSRADLYHLDLIYNLTQCTYAVKLNCDALNEMKFDDLKELDSSLSDCGVIIRRDKELLRKVCESTSVGCYVIDDKVGRSMASLTTSAPRMYDIGKVRIDCCTFTYYPNKNFGIRVEYKEDYIIVTHENIDRYRCMTPPEFISLMKEKALKHCNSLSVEYQKKRIEVLEENIESYMNEIDSLKARMDGLSRKESLITELKIIENEEEVEKARNTISDIKNDILDIPSLIENYADCVGKKLKEMTDNGSK